jgi:hypothetical protein
MAQAQFGHADLQTTLGFTRTSCLSRNGGRWGRFRLVWRWKSRHWRRPSVVSPEAPGSDPKYESRQSTLGRAAHPELLKPGIEASQASFAK